MAIWVAIAGGSSGSGRSSSASAARLSRGRPGGRCALAVERADEGGVGPPLGAAQPLETRRMSGVFVHYTAHDGAQVAFLFADDAGQDAPQPDPGEQRLVKRIDGAGPLFDQKR